MNQNKKPFERQAGPPRAQPRAGPVRGLEGAVTDRVVKEVAGIQVPGTPWATPPEELVKLAGYGRDINAARRRRGVS